MYNHKDKCLKCKYGWFPANMHKFLGTPMCLYYHDTGMHRDGDDNTCNSFEKLTQEEIQRNKEENRRRYRDAKSNLFY